MIKINLLGKKKAAAVPFGLDEKLEKLGIGMGDFQELRPGLVRLAFLLVGLYIAHFVPTYLHEEKVRKLDAELSKLAMRNKELSAELAAKRDIRKQMEQLQKEEVELRRQLNAINDLKRNRGAAYVTVNDVMKNLMKADKVWLETFSYDTSKVKLSGRAWEYFPINDFVKAISESTRYGNVAFREVKAEDAKKKVPGVPESAQKTKKFDLDFLVKDGEGGGG